MSKSYWRSATFRNWLIALLILAALIGAPLVAARLPSDRFMGLPSTLAFLAIGMPLIFVVLALFKITLQQGLDRSYELDTEDQLQRRRVPKRLKAFPVKAIDVPDPEIPDATEQTDAKGSQFADSSKTPQNVAKATQSNETRVAG